MSIKYKEIKQQYIDYFWKKIIFPKDLKNECWTTTYKCRKNGYFTVCFNYKIELGHRFSWMIHNKKDIPKGMMICHKCGNKNCISPEHIYLGNHQENTKDAIINDEYCRGENHHNSKFTKNQIFNFLDIINNVVFKSQIEIANILNITPFDVYSILNLKLRKRDILEWCNNRNIDIIDLKNKSTIRKLSIKEKNEIKEKLILNYSIDEISNLYKIGKTAIYRIKKTI